MTHIQRWGLPWRLALPLLLALMFTLWHAPSHAALKFGTVDRLRHVADTPLTDAQGAKLYLARHIVEKHFLLPYAMEDRGHVLGIVGDSRRYYPLPTGEQLAALQQAGQLPTPLPAYEPSTLDRIVGHALWFFLLGLALYFAAHTAWRRWRARRASTGLPLAGSEPDTQPQTQPQADDFAATLPPLDIELPMRLQPSRLKMLGFLALSAAFVLLGWLIRHEHPVVGTLCMAFFGLGLPIFTLQLLPNSATYLELHADHFRFSTFFRKHSVRWRDVDTFAVVKLQGRTMVGWLLRPDASPGAHRTSMSRSFTGVDAALPDTYRMRPQALAELMDIIRLHDRQRAPGAL